MNWTCTGDQLVSLYLPLEVAEHLQVALFETCQTCDSCKEIKKVLDDRIRAQKEAQNAVPNR